MAQPAPVGIFGLARRNLRDLIASSAEFQSAVGAANEIDAKEYIFFTYPTVPEVNLDFFVVIGNRLDGGPDTYRTESYGGTTSVIGAVGAVFWAVDSAPTQEYDEITRVLDLTDQIIEEMNLNRSLYFDFLSAQVWQPMHDNEDDNSAATRRIFRAVQFEYGPSPG